MSERAVATDGLVHVVNAFGDESRAVLCVPDTQRPRIVEMTGAPSTCLYCIALDVLLTRIYTSALEQGYLLESSSRRRIT